VFKRLPTLKNCLHTINFESLVSTTTFWEKALLIKIEQYTYLFTFKMAAKSILEADGKAILNYHLTRAPVIKPSPLPKSGTHNPPSKLASLYFPEDAEVSAILDQAEVSYPWLLVPGAKFVAKPDQLIKRRGKSGLLALNKTWPEAKAWIAARAGKSQKVETVVGVLRQFLVEPFVPHPEGTEYYVNINSQREVCFTFDIVFAKNIFFEGERKKREDVECFKTSEKQN